MHSRCSGTFPSAFLVVLSLFGSTTASAAPLVTLANGFDIYNTGMLLSGDVDQRWYMTVNPYNGSANASLNAAAYLSSNDTSSAWVGPSGPNVHAPESVYRIATTVDLTGLDLATVVLAGFWISDNQGLDILVNGNSTGQTNTGAHTALPGAFAANAFSISAADGLVAALNIIEFEWGNGPAGGAGSQVPNPIHVRVEFVSATSTVIPVPASLVLLGSALGLLGGLRRRLDGQPPRTGAAT